MVAVMLVRRVKALLLLLLAAVRRCFCCLRSRRDSVPALPIVTQASGECYQQEGGSWEEWEGPSSVVCDGGSGLRKMSPIEQQIHDYRISQQRRINEVSAPQEEEPNLFEDLAPSLPRKPQVVIYARPDDDTNTVSNRHSISVNDALMQVGGELGEWDEEGGEGQWDSGGEGAGELDELLQQQKQQERQQQRLAREARKQARANREQREARGKIATKLS